MTMPITTVNVLSTPRTLRKCVYCQRQTILVNEDDMWAYVTCLWCHMRGPRFSYNRDGNSAPARAIRAWEELSA